MLVVIDIGSHYVYAPNISYTCLYMYMSSLARGC